MLTFNVIDVETANADRASICQIGIVHVREGNIEDQWKTLVNPEDWVDPWNISFHGIDEHMVRNSPTLPDLRGELRSRLRSSVLISHGSFDRIAFERAMTRYQLEQLQVMWLSGHKGFLFSTSGSNRAHSDMLKASARKSHLHIATSYAGSTPIGSR